MLVGEKIKRIRQQADLSQEQIAQFMGIDPGVVAEYENGQRPIPVHHLERFGCLFGLRLADLVLVDDAGRKAWDLKPQIRIALSDRMDGSNLAAIAEILKIALNLDEMSKRAQKNPTLTPP